MLFYFIINFSKFGITIYKKIKRPGILPGRLVFKI